MIDGDAMAAECAKQFLKLIAWLIVVLVICAVAGLSMKQVFSAPRCEKCKAVSKEGGR